MRDFSARKLTILLVDDDPAMIRLLRTVLTLEMHDEVELHTETDPLVALEWLEDHHCDIVLSDIEMPQLDGLELLRFAKRRNAWTQVVFITAHSSFDRITAAVELGADDYLLKPIDRETLIEVVTQLCRRSARWQSAVLGTMSLT
ncbi:MAG: response regulator [Planctomycetia bacterium]|nr:response regulator [Planctomycetia bacterium]